MNWKESIFDTTKKFMCQFVLLPRAPPYVTYYLNDPFDIIRIRTHKIKGNIYFDYPKLKINDIPN
jgi:hypothetical protein